MGRGRYEEEEDEEEQAKDPTKNSDDSNSNTMMCGGQVVYGSISSMVVRPPSDSKSNDNNNDDDSAADFEPGEFRCDDLSHPFHNSGHEMKTYNGSDKAVSVSPMHRKKSDQYTDEYDRNGHSFHNGGQNLHHNSQHINDDHEFDHGRRHNYDHNGHDSDLHGHNIEHHGRGFDRGAHYVNRGARNFDRGERRGFDHSERGFGRVGHGFDREMRGFDRDFDHSRPPSRGFRGGRGRGRFSYRSPPPFIGRGRHPSPPSMGRGRQPLSPPSIGRGRYPYGRSFGGPGPDHSPPLHNASVGRNNPNITPREGDWICSESTCGNLNFARRSHCNNCNKPRRDMAPFSAGVGNRPGFQGPPMPHSPMVGGLPMGRPVGRAGAGFVEPTTDWGRGSPLEFDQGPPFRPNDRFSDMRPGRPIRDRADFPDHDDFRERERFDRPPPVDWAFDPRVRNREDRFHAKRPVLYDPRNSRRPLSPPPRGQWSREDRERSRSPIRTPPKDYYREPYFDRRRDDRRVGRRDRLDEAY